MATHQDIIAHVGHTAELARCLDEVQDAQHAHDEGHADAGELAQTRRTLVERFDLWSASVASVAMSVGRDIPR